MSREPNELPAPELSTPLTIEADAVLRSAGLRDDVFVRENERRLAEGGW